MFKSHAHFLGVLSNHVVSSIRNLMFLSMLGRIGNIVSFVIGGMGWHNNSPEMYVFTVAVLIQVSSLVSSTAQIWIAVEFTSSSIKKKPVVSTIRGTATGGGEGNISSILLVLPLETPFEVL